MDDGLLPWCYRTPAAREGSTRRAGETRTERRTEGEAETVGWKEEGTTTTQSQRKTSREEETRRRADRSGGRIEYFECDTLRSSTSAGGC